MSTFWKIVILIVGVALVVALGFIAYALLREPAVPVATNSSVMVQAEEGSSSLPARSSASGQEVASREPAPPDWAVALGQDEIVGYTYPLGMEGPWRQSVPEGGFLLVTCGNCTVDGKKATSDGTQGTVFVLVGTNADGSTPEDLNRTVVIDDYTPGHIQVTFIYAGNEDPEESGLSAVANMFGPPNCGAEGCLTVYLFSRFADGDWEEETFTDPPG